MKIEIRADRVEIEGYVNAVERNSKTLWSRIGRFIERICKGAFTKAINRNDEIHILLNHDWDRDLGSTKKGNLELHEDSIGLHARATITDRDVIEKARNGDLVGWSFGFSDREVENEVEKGLPLRLVKDLDLYEVSILDRTKEPAYEGTLVSTRADTKERHLIGDDFQDEIEIREITEEAVTKMEEPEGSIATKMEDAETITINGTELRMTPEGIEVVSTPEEREETQPKQQNVDTNKSIDYSKAEAIVNELKKMRG